jgi:hypothetical protein
MVILQVLGYFHHHLITSLSLRQVSELVLLDFLIFFIKISLLLFFGLYFFQMIGKPFISRISHHRKNEEKTECEPSFQKRDNSLSINDQTGV